MKALTWHGMHDVRVDTVPDPAIEQPTDAIIKVTSSGICGSDLHLYEVLGPFLDAGDILGHEPMGIVEEVGSEVTRHQARRPGRDPVQHLLRALLHVRHGPAVAVRDDPGARVRHRRRRCSATRSSTARCRAARPSTCASRRPSTGRSRCPTARRTTASCTSPTCCPPPGRRSSTRTSPRAAACSCSGSGRSARCARGSPSTRAPRQVIGIDLVPDRLARARAHGVDALDLEEHDDLAGRGARAHRRPRPGLRDRRRRHGGARRSDRQARPPARRLAARTSPRAR